MEGKVTMDQLEEIRLLADQLETRLRLLRNQEQDHDQESKNYAVLFQATSMATNTKIAVLACMFNLKKGKKK